MKELAAKAGISPDAVNSHLAQFLPMLVDKLTPNGRFRRSSLLEDGMGCEEPELGKPAPLLGDATQTLLPRKDPKLHEGKPGTKSFVRLRVLGG